MTKYKNVQFVVPEFNRETDPVTLTYYCANYSDETLGFVKWHSDWKQYCYLDTCNGAYSQDCMESIADFLARLNNLKNNPK